MFPPGSISTRPRCTIRAWQGRQYDDKRSGWSVERFTNILGYRIIELMEAGREGDAQTAVRLIADACGFGDEAGLLKSLAEGFECHRQGSLAAVTYTLAWTRARSHGGWLRFGGETEIKSLKRATQLDRSLTLRTISEEVERAVARGLGTHGITQALIYGFANAGLDDSSSVPFDIWNEAFTVIADRLPRVTAVDDPEDLYVAPNPDNGAELLGNIDAAFAAATVAGLAHPGREQKRRSLVAIQVLIDEKVSAATEALGSALSSLSDPATLTWLLRVIELAREKATPVVSQSRNTLVELAGSPHLTVRALARRLLAGNEVPLAPPAQPDSELLDSGSTDLVFPGGATVVGGDTAQTDGIVDTVAGVRLSRAEPILPGLRSAVRKRVDAEWTSETQMRRIQAQRDAYTDVGSKRFPDVFLASIEAVEDSMQRAASGARAAMLMNHEPVADPAKLEETLANALLDDTKLPLAVERTRHPRPEIPPPPPRGDPLWRALDARSKGERADENGIEAAIKNGNNLFATIAISASEAVPAIVDGPYGGWRLLAAVERRTIPRTNGKSEMDYIAERYRVVELRLNGDRQALTLPPITRGDIRTWKSNIESYVSAHERIRTEPVVGCDFEVAAAGDSHHGLGIQTPLLTPTARLFTALTLKRSKYFVIDDDAGRAFALITWRTEYETSEHFLAWPRLHGAGLVVRSDAFDNLVRAAQGHLIFRDFLMGPSSLCS